jgi:hypothetical protein
MTNMNLSRNFFDESDNMKKFKIVVCDKTKGCLFETTTDSIDDFIFSMVRLGYRNFQIRASGFFLEDEYFCIVN